MTTSRKVKIKGAHKLFRLNPMVGEEIEVDGKVYAVALSATKILIGGCACRDCVGGSAVDVCNAICGNDILCPVPEHMNFKLKGDNDESRGRD